MYESARKWTSITYWEGIGYRLVHRSRGGLQFVGTFCTKRWRDLCGIAGKHSHRQVNTPFPPKLTPEPHYSMFLKYTSQPSLPALHSYPPIKPPPPSLLELWERWVLWCRRLFFSNALSWIKYGNMTLFLLRMTKNGCQAKILACKLLVFVIFGTN